MTDLTLPITVAVTLVTILVSVAASYAVTRHQAAAAEKKAIEVEKALAEFRIFVMDSFVKSEVLVRLEERIIGAIDRLADRIDRAIEGKQK